MSISSEITRISGNVSSAMTAIRNKGVTIPSGSNSDDLATLIGQIQQTGSAITITDESDSAGGVHRIITGVTLNNDTVQPGTLAKNVTAHNALGQAITGTADIHDPNNTYDFLGINVEYVQQLLAKKWKLSQTDFANITPSSTSQTILGSQSGTQVTLDLENYEYWLIWRWQTTLAYQSGTATNARVEQEFGVLTKNIMRRPYGLANFSTMTDSYNYSTLVNSTSISYMVYYTTKSALSWTTTITYGFPVANTGDTLSSTSSLTPKLTPQSPTVSCRTNNSYLTVANAGKILKDDSTIVMLADLYRVKKASSWGYGMYRKALEMYGTPINAPLVSNS